jgi:hypothetical protein
MVRRPPSSFYLLVFLSRCNRDKCMRRSVYVLRQRTCARHTRNAHAHKNTRNISMGSISPRSGRGESSSRRRSASRTPSEDYSARPGSPPPELSAQVATAPEAVAQPSTYQQPPANGAHQRGKVPALPLQELSRASLYSIDASNRSSADIARELSPRIVPREIIYTTFSEAADHASVPVDRPPLGRPYTLDPSLYPRTASVRAQASPMRLSIAPSIPGPMLPLEYLVSPRLLSPRPSMLLTSSVKDLKTDAELKEQALAERQRLKELEEKLKTSSRQRLDRHPDVLYISLVQPCMQCVRILACLGPQLCGSCTL